VIKICHRDPKFSYDCLYLIGVYGYENSTFTILGQQNESEIISLTLNRPQIVFGADPVALKYFSVLPASSVDDITISVTSLTTGEFSQFAKKNNPKIKK